MSPSTRSMTTRLPDIGERCRVGVDPADRRPRRRAAPPSGTTDCGPRVTYRWRRQHPHGSVFRPIRQRPPREDDTCRPRCPLSPRRMRVATSCLAHSLEPQPARTMTDQNDDQGQPTGPAPHHNPPSAGGARRDVRRDGPGADETRREPQIQRGQDNSASNVDVTRPPMTTTANGKSASVPATRPKNNNGNSAATIVSALSTIGPTRRGHANHRSTDPHCGAYPRSPYQQNVVPGGNPKIASSPINAPRGSGRLRPSLRQHAADHGHGKMRKISAANRQLPNAAWSRGRSPRRQRTPPADPPELALLFAACRCAPQRGTPAASPSRGRGSDLADHRGEIGYGRSP